MEGRTCGGCQRKTVLIGTGAVWGMKRGKGQEGCVCGASAKTVLIGSGAVWGRKCKGEYGEHLTKIVMIGIGAIWGKNCKEEYVEKSTKNCDDRDSVGLYRDRN
ncbi:hypothetical protein CY34DRAFT_394258 [Suillus luteus UH-Slu-Lm8-n1]|uniref:Uncharacterized protein n=1 Tax=Suillus luteus UH-Slu-Lm8-n1 TaxID=930992 RepID=A0A0D0A9L0_9AGAM|nr:hypothetical protein CY34DRAFT_394258 [Suillus luteus UH-Slu-Lm8-n1]